MNQLIRAQIPITREVAKVMGVAESQVAKLTEQGKVGFDTINKALQNLTNEGGQFFNMTLDSSKTLEGRWSTLTGVIADMGDALASIFTKDIKSGLELMIKVAEAYGGTFRGIALDDKITEQGIYGRGPWGNFAGDSAYARLMNQKMSAARPNEFGVKGKPLTALQEKALARAAQIEIKKLQEAFAADKAKRLAGSPAKLTAGDEASAKNTLDKFFQGGQFMFNPSSIPEISIQEQQLSMLSQIEMHMRNAFPGGSDDVIKSSAKQTFNAIKNGVGVN